MIQQNQLTGSRIPTEPRLNTQFNAHSLGESVHCDPGPGAGCVSLGLRGFLQLLRGTMEESLPGWRIWRIMRCMRWVGITQRESGHDQRLRAAYLAVATITAPGRTHLWPTAHADAHLAAAAAAHAAGHCSRAHRQSNAAAIDAAMADCVAASWHTLRHLLWVAAQSAKRIKRGELGQSWASSFFGALKT